jgi:hypothetical protein
VVRVLFETKNGFGCECGCVGCVLLSFDVEAIYEAG